MSIVKDGSVLEVFNGDVIQLLTGGPLMTVELTRHDGLITATWFDHGGSLHRDAFDPKAIKKWIEAQI